MHSEIKSPVSQENPSTFRKNGDNLHLLAACETEDAPLLMLTLSALWSHDTTVYSSTPTISAPQVSWTVVGGVIQRRAGEIAPLIRLSSAEQTSVSNTLVNRVTVTANRTLGSQLENTLEHTIHLTSGGGSTHRKKTCKTHKYNMHSQGF